MNENEEFEFRRRRELEAGHDRAPAAGPETPADAAFVGPKDVPADNRGVLERMTGEKSVGGLLASGARKIGGAIKDTVAEPRGGEMLNMAKEAFLTGRKYPEGHEPVDIDAKGAHWLAPLVMGGGGNMMRAPGIQGSFSSASYADAEIPAAIGAANREALRHALVETMVKGYKGGEAVAGAAKNAITAAPGLLLKLGKRALPWALGTATGGAISRHLP